MLSVSLPCATESTISALGVLKILDKLGGTKQTWNDYELSKAGTSPNLAVPAADVLKHGLDVPCVTRVDDTHVVDQTEVWIVDGKAAPETQETDIAFWDCHADSRVD